MIRMLFFAAGLAAGAALTGGHALLSAEAAPEPRGPAAGRAMPKVRPQPQFLESLCAPGFRHTPKAGGRYTCNRAATTLCPRGATPVNVKLYRSGHEAGDTRLLYECRTSEVVRPHCGRGFVPAALKLYRSGVDANQSRLIYECVRYRSGNE